MKLTNYIRDAFVTSVMDDVPAVDYHEQYRKMFLEALLDTLPQGVQMLWINPALRPYVKTSICHSGPGQSFAVPHPIQYESVPVPAKAATKLGAIKRADEGQRTAHDALRAHVYAAAKACSTTKQLRELLPEFGRYLPDEEEKTLRTLPVVQNIVADFVKAGWPTKKGEKKCAA